MRERDWTIKIELSSSSFESLQRLTARILQEVAGAQSYRDIAHLSGGGEGADSTHYSVVLNSPVEVRVRQLRKEADELEATLITPTR